MYRISDNVDIATLRELDWSNAAVWLDKPISSA
jgi:hypothetical protein